MNDAIARPSLSRTRKLSSLLVAAAAAALALSANAAGQVYKCVDNAGRVTYQQTPCPAAAKGGRVELFLDNGASRGSGDDEAQWEAAAQQHTVVVGMPKRYVQKSLGSARDMRPGRLNENAAEVWAYPRENETLRIGFLSGAVVWQRTDPGTAELSAAERVRIAARAAVSRGQSCDQMFSDLGAADRQEPVPTDPGSVARRFIWEPAPGDERTRTIVVCVNGVVQEIERQGT